ncbi:MATE family efflux transporter [Ruminococcus sp. CLA-AA-H200]|uniref:Probable multidrug resistance protein NorM n=1 Tax=Ruminococcus turbiniformis TaxID=2881258 RepID=A0ABS8FW95_9FIRM|nr:MATE family efflux transporter [Ruminococcus turbiniformis]MCC2254222.1 MATE family efflux transporter [Ruminococcus turbiniformis]
MQNDYLVQKKPFNALFIFSLPMIIGNLFQQTYTMADSAIVGRYVGEQALAAVGASYSLTNIFICIAFGGGVGASVVVSRYFGAKELNRMKLAVLTSFVTFLVISFALGGTGLLLSRHIMILLNTPADVLDMAVEYLNIYFLGLPFLFMYNILSSMFNALGKSRIPLYFLIFSSLFNIWLDIVLITRFHMGVAGAAWATLIAQGISAVLSFLVFMILLKKLNCGHTKPFDREELSEMTRIALPSILQQSTVSIGMMLVQSVVNGFGSQALAGFSAGMRVESMCIVPMQALGNAVSSFTAQNIGAQKKERVPSGYRSSVRLVILYAVIICVILELFHEPVIQFFLGEDGTAKALQTGSDYLVFMGWFFCLIGFKMTVDGVLRGAGDMKMFTIANLVNLSIRVVLSMTLAPVAGIGMVWYSVPIGWFANWAISYRQYRTGKWRTL